MKGSVKVKTWLSCLSSMYRSRSEYLNLGKSWTWDFLCIRNTWGLKFNFLVPNLGSSFGLRLLHGWRQRWWFWRMATRTSEIQPRGPPTISYIQDVENIWCCSMVPSKTKTHISRIDLVRPVLNFPQFLSRIHQAVQHWFFFNMCSTYIILHRCWFKINGSINSP